MTILFPLKFLTTAGYPAIFLGIINCVHARMFNSQFRLEAAFLSTSNHNRIKIIQRIFFVYCAFLLILMFFREQFDIDTTYYEQLTRNLNLVPFRSITTYLYLMIYKPNDALFSYAFLNFFGNLVLFIPFGFLLPCLWIKVRVFWRIISFSTGIIALLEVIQLFTLLGSFDIDDLLLNLIGVAVGYMLFYFARRKWNLAM